MSFMAPVVSTTIDAPLPSVNFLISSVSLTFLGKVLTVWVAPSCSAKFSLSGNRSTPTIVLQPFILAAFDQG